MKTLIYNLLVISFLSCCFSCQDTKLGDTDLDFDAILESNIADANNNYPFETKVKFKEGSVKYGNKTIKSNDALPTFDYRANGTLYFNYVPATKGSQTIDITIKNERVTKTVSCEVDCKDALYAVEIKDTPERPFILLCRLMSVNFGLVCRLLKAYYRQYNNLEDQ